MTLFKTILSPVKVNNFTIKNEDQAATLADYTLVSVLPLDKQYGTATLKRIRFSLIYPTQGPHSAVDHLFHPYQVHIQWIDDTDPGYQIGLVVQNAVYAAATGELLNEVNMSLVRPAYSTFCQFDSALIDGVSEPNSPASTFNHGDMAWYNYNLKRNALIKEGAFSTLAFELYFTNLRGQRIYRYIPNVEVEFDVN